MRPWAHLARDHSGGVLASIPAEDRLSCRPPPCIVYYRILICQTSDVSDRSSHELNVRKANGKVIMGSSMYAQCTNSDLQPSDEGHAGSPQVHPTQDQTAVRERSDWNSHSML